MPNNDENMSDPLPEELARIFGSLIDYDGGYTVDDAITYLRSAISAEALQEAPDETPAAAAWTDRFFSEYLIIGEDGYLERWETHADQLGPLLEEAEGLLAPEIRRVGEDAVPNRGGPIDRVAVSQRLNAYATITAAVCGDVSAFRERLDRVIADTLANIEFLLARFDAMEILGRESSFSEAFGACWWTEPLDICAYAACAMRQACAIRRAYEGVLRHLESVRCYPTGARGVLMTHAEQAIDELLGASAEEIYPSMPDPDMTRKVHALTAENPGIPVIVQVGARDDPFPIYADVVDAEIVDVLDARVPSAATLVTSRSELEGYARRAVEDPIHRKDLGMAEGMGDADIKQAVGEFVAEYEKAWTKAIRIRAVYSEL